MKKIATSAFMLTLVFNLGASEANIDKELAFRVYLDDRRIGTHKVTLIEDEQGKRVNTSAKFKVKVLFATVFRYKHSTQEIWQDGCLADIQSKTNNNGKKTFIKKMDSDDGFMIDTHDGEQQLDGCIRTFAYWDPDLLKTERLLNTQTGEYELVELIDMGQDALTIGKQTIDTQQYRLMVGESYIDLWYTPNKEWVALKSRTEDGNLISYYTKNKELL